jgi:TonB-dependent SusC/RagA subfamily outer membrane receptor
MEYLLKASGIVVILFLFYELFLKKETFFTSIRVYFIIGLLFVISIPLIEIPIYVKAATTSLSTLNFQEITSTQLAQDDFNWLQLVVLAYLIGVVFFSVKFLIQLFSLLLFISKHKIFKNDSYYFIETTKNCSPFSFFNIIIFNKSQFSEDELIQILNHEKAHVLQWHSLDTLLAHLLVITLWFNPFVWLYKKSLLQNLEFLADAEALKLANNQQLYQFTLLKTCSNNYCTEITNNFYNSLIKTRIMMLHKNKSTNKNQFKYLLLIPILVGFIMTFNTKIVAQEKNSWEINVAVIDLIIDKNSTNENLDQEAATFKNELGILLNFKSIKRNSANEIIAIKIDAKGENVKASFENNGTTPIKPIRISFDSKNNTLNIGNVSEQTSTFIIEEKPTKSGTYVFVNSNGEKTSWTTKNTDTIIQENKIIINGDNVWVQKEGEEKNIKVDVTEDGNKKIVRIIKNGEEIEVQEDLEMEFTGTDNASENVYIIKNSDGNIEKTTEKIVVRSSGNNNEKPLCMIDGKEITNEEMENIKPETIESINVLKGENATAKYGESAKNGVIEITLKKQ